MHSNGLARTPSISPTSTHTWLFVVSRSFHGCQLIAQEIKGWDAQDKDRAIYVNIGGGIGHQCKQFKEKYPDLNGRVILQDLPPSIAKALPTEGVENMEHDFFEPQPIKSKSPQHFLLGRENDQI